MHCDNDKGLQYLIVAEFDTNKDIGNACTFWKICLTSKLIKMRVDGVPCLKRAPFFLGMYWKLLLNFIPRSLI